MPSSMHGPNVANSLNLQQIERVMILSLYFDWANVLLGFPFYVFYSLGHEQNK